MQQNLHRLLRRQLKKYLPPNLDSTELDELLTSIDAAYRDFDNDIVQAENTLEQSSKELFKVNEELKSRVQTKTQEAAELSTRIESIVNSVQEIIFQTDLEGRWTYLNPAWTAITGFDVKSSLGKHFKEFVFAEDWEESKNHLKELLEGNQTESRYSLRYRTKNQHIRWVEAFVNLNYNQAGEIIGSSGTLNDITHRVESQQELKRLALVAEKTDNIVVVSDPQGKIEWVNKAFEKRTGYELVEVKGLKPGSFLQGEKTNKNTASDIGKALRNRESYIGEIYNYSKQGEGYWLSISITPIFNNSLLEGFIAVQVDITAKKEDEQRLYEAQQTLQFATEGNGFGIWDWQLPNNQVSFSDTWKSMVGYKPEELEDSFSSFEKLVLNEDHSKYQKALESYFKGETDHYQVEFRMQHKKGHYLWVLALGKVVSYTDEGEPLRIVGTHQDISDRKTQEQRLEHYASDLEKINAELDKFAYVVSHDLKAPLRAINNLSEWIQEDLEEVMEEETKEQMGLLRGRVNRMENLINGILQYSRAGRVKADLRPVQTGKVVNEIIEHLDPPKHFNIKVSTNFPDLLTEEVALEQVFTNFISNAIKYNDSPEPEINIEWEDRGEFVAFYIIDNGPGIDPKFHDKVFVIFQTLQPRDRLESTGVGLAIVKKIVEEKGGEVTLESNVNEGCKFTFTWPKKG